MALKRTGVSQTGGRDAEALCARLHRVYHQAKGIGYVTPDQCEVFIQRTIQLTQEYPEKTANKIGAAAPTLFTF